MLGSFSRFLILTTFESLSFAPGASWAQNKQALAPGSGIVNEGDWISP
jgi:hypothetical protein